MARGNKAVKMSDIAQKLNVSVVTVSKALSDQTGVSQELREKIKKLAKEMGYDKSVSERSTRGNTYTIGIVIPKRYIDDSESFYWKMYKEITDKSMEKGCFTMLEILPEDISDRLPMLIAEDKVDGLIVLGKPGHDYAKYLEKQIKIPMLFLDFHEPECAVDAIISNSYLGEYLMTKYLLKRGHRQIAYVGTLMATDSITDRYLGYVKALMEYNLSPCPEWVINDRDKDTGLMEHDKEIVLPDKLPTAFVCNCDYIAGIVINMLRKRGVRVPEDVSVVGFDNYLYRGICDIGITTYEVNIGRMADKAVQILLKKMTDVSYHAGLVIIEGCLVEKESVRKMEL